MSGKASTSILLYVLLCLAGPLAGQSSYRQTQLNYVDQFKDIAIREMDRTGIPASIKLAQALLESGAGTSDLARKANNHFGIKCGIDWSGDIYHKEDDDYDTVGALQKSCFRAYEDPEASFIAHSEFLRAPNRQNRYGFLFKLDPTDYKAWAQGLRQAGYATNPNYPQLLINSIETLGLHQYDLPESRRRTQVWPMADAQPKQAREIQGMQVFIAEAGQTPMDIAMKTGAPLSRIMSWNEGLESRTQVLEQGDKIYLSKKKRKYKGPSKWHYVRQEESMFDISQAYGLRLSRLYRLNRLPEGVEPAVGERIHLKKRVSKKHIPRIRREEIPGEQPGGAPNNRQLAEAKVSGLVHTVVSGDTLYAISRRYGISVDAIREQNRLSDNAIRPGQQLRIR